mmetsp:Transcript_5425/g.9570  ORF Transcript_5425/g.9570 Transcript_5425/m.9570 type:complete len:451 (-) Transcript_5425:1121-2473(-)
MVGFVNTVSASVLFPLTRTSSVDRSIVSKSEFLARNKRLSVALSVENGASTSKSSIGYLSMNSNDSIQDNNDVIKESGISRRQLLDSAALGALAAAIEASVDPINGATAATTAVESWTKVDLPGTDQITVFDMAFVPGNTQKGWLVGTRGTVMETSNGGRTWEPRAFQNLDAEDEINYRFQNISFYEQEGWVIGKPAILLHTRDGGKSWERVQLSPKLPGEPIVISALGPNSAEMTTTAGAVYTTSNGGRNWKAQVKETIDATLNRTVSSGVSGASYFTGSIISVLRDASGSYLAVSSRGNFYLTWQPGQEFWIPHGRDTSRRIQAMGFIDDDISQGLWMSTRGGGLSFSKKGSDLQSAQTIEFDKVDIRSGGYGILDVAFRPGTPEVWATVGGGSLWVSRDHGVSWTRDNSVTKAGGIIYRIKFFDKDTAFALGANGILLRYNLAAKTA